MDKKYHKDCIVCKNYKEFELPRIISESIHDVVLFVGAGISTESKIAFPDTFYETICRELDINPRKNISFSKIMTIYCKKTGSKSQLLNKIKERLDYFKSWSELYFRATLFHRELALFPCIENIITTNWDDFIEKETNAIPFVYDEDLVFWERPGKKVLKIHGSINNLGSIVATEEDYKKCYERLQKGIIGSQMKLFLAKNIVIFIGYSFQDEDFQKIYKYVLKNIKACKKQAYIVTLDTKFDKQWKKMGIIPIYTDGSFFIHRLRKEFEKNGCLLSIDNLPKILAIKEQAFKIHNDTIQKFPLSKYPEVIYCLAYQDGILHAFDYLINKIDSGYSLCSRNLLRSIESYEVLIKRYKKPWNTHAYLEGFLHGLYIFNGAMFTDIKIEMIPVFFYYNEITKEKYLDNIDFKRSLKKISKNSKIRKVADKYIKDKKIGKDITFHHIPRL